MRVWMVTKNDEPMGAFLTEAEARMHVMMKWPDPALQRGVIVFEWDETMDFFRTMDAVVGREGFDADVEMF